MCGVLRVLGVPYLQQGSLDSQDLHGVSAGEDLQGVRCFAHRLNLLVDLCPHLETAANIIWRHLKLKSDHQPHLSSVCLCYFVPSIYFSFFTSRFVGVNVTIFTFEEPLIYTEIAYLNKLVRSPEQPEGNSVALGRTGTSALYICFNMWSRQPTSNTWTEKEVFLLCRNVLSLFISEDGGQLLVRQKHRWVKTDFCLR